MSGLPGGLRADAARRFDELLDRALGMPAEERNAFLTRECAGDQGLRAELDRFRVDGADATFGEPRTGGGGTPDFIGPYRILQRLGEGGMGEVFRARQEEPVAREVALKVVRSGLDSVEVLRRFERERDALAELDHRHVAKVLDAGLGEDGQPFVVMELVSGEPIVAHCNGRRLDVRARLRLFLQVCSAIEHAHHKGIVHRDLKPSNVLVTAGGECKVIDFGIAKATGGERSGHAELTIHGQFLGTPEYSSPEQLGSSDDVDTRTDVYSLGAMLYELLTGQRPLATELRNARGWSDLVRSIVEIAPERPSRLRRGLGSDLDWICLRALEKDRERRYRSPAEFAADVDRYLRFDPILARPPSAIYRARRFARRHRSIVATACGVAIALVAGLWSSAEGFLAASAAWKRECRTNEDLRRMADLQVLREAERGADALWPATPDLVPALHHWLDEYAAPLAERRALHVARLAALRAAALPETAEDRARDRDRHPFAVELSLARMRVRFLHTDEGRARYPQWKLVLALVEQEVAELAPQVERRRTWRFSGEVEQWEHDTLAQLVSDLERFFDRDAHRGVVRGIERRLQDAARIDEANRQGDAQGVWAHAIAEVRESPRYCGLELEPQVGLIPLACNAQGLWEFWHVASGSRPEPATSPDSESSWEVGEDDGIVLVLIPGGRALVGAQRADPAAPHFDALAEPDEAVQEVELRPYFLGKYELTFAQWQRFTGVTPYGGRGRLEPVGNLTWFECARQLARLGLRLPTEAQWEHGARGGTTTRWWWGDEVTGLLGRANVADASTVRDSGRMSWPAILSVDDGYSRLSPVGRFCANAFGLHDMAGNVYDWCADPYVAIGYTTHAGDGLRSPPTGSAAPNDFTCRGGAWQRPAENARSAEREHFEPGTRLTYVGVRAARPLDCDRAAVRFPDPPSALAEDRAR